MNNLTYSYYVNNDRYHGFQLPLEKLKGYLVISADFAISEEEVKSIVDNDTVLLSTDHHDVQNSFIDVKGATAEGIVINNQYPFEPSEDKYLSGAGVFYELICSLYPNFKSLERDVLVAITLLSDVRQIENSKARAYLKKAYSYDTSKDDYISYLINSTLDSDYSFGMPRMDRNFIDFTLSPYINALLRADRTSEAINFILGANYDKTSATKIRNSQKDLQSIVENKMHVEKFNNIHIISINALDFLHFNVKLTGYLGLICGKYKDKNNGVSVIGFVYENGKILRTSFRGKYDDVHYLHGVRNLGIDAEGHPNAFGIKNFHPTTDTWIQLDDLVGDLESDHIATFKVIESSNLMITLTNIGMKLANENCYVRDMYRTYIKYIGKNAKVVKVTYKYEEFTHEDYVSGIKPAKQKNGVSFKYQLDRDGNPIIKYMEYLIDGRTVKSFGVSIEDGVILPILERGYIQLYIRSPLK